MADTFVMTASGTIDVDSTLSGITNLKDLFNIDFVEDTDNVALLRKQCYLMYHKILELERRIKSLEKR